MRFVTAAIAFKSTILQLDAGSIKDIDYGTNTRDQNMSLTFGVIEQNVTIKFYDRNKVVYGLFERKQDTKATLVIREYEDGELVDTDDYKVSDIEINEEGDQVTVRGVDATSILDTIDIGKNLIEDRSVHDLLTIFFSKLPETYTWDYFDDETSKMCHDIVAYSNWYRDDTLRNFLDKVCVLGLLRIYYKNGVFHVTRCI